MEKMHKKLIAIVFLVLCFTGVSAQKYKIKKNLLLKDKKPIGRIFGEAGVDDTKFVITTLSNEEVLKVSQGAFKVDNPYFDNIYWYNIKFSDTNNDLNLYHGGNCNVKCVIKNILVPSKIIPGESFISNQQQIISEYDVSTKIGQDTLEILQSHNEMISLLKENEILRDFQKPIKMFVINEYFEPASSTKTTEYNIAQDNEIIGSIVKRHFQNSTGVRVDYEVYEKLYEPYGGKDKVPACKVTSTFIDLEFQTVIDGEKHKINVPDKYNAQQLLAIYLVEKGYL